MYLCFKVAPAGVFFAISSVIAVYFLLDIVINFFVGYVDKEGLVVMHLAPIAKKYLSSWFILDIVASVPLEWMELNSSANQLRVIRFLRLLRMARLMRLMKMKSLMSSVEEMVEGNQLVQFTIGLAKLLGALFVTTHWAACIWWAVGAKARRGESWVDPFVETYPLVQERYVWSLYFTLTTMTTVGYGDISPVNYDEALFALILLPVASVLFATLMGNLTDLITNLNERGRQRQKKKIMLSHYMAWRGVPPKLRAQIRQCFLFLWDTKEDYEVYEEEVKSQLPSVLKEELCLHFYGRLLNRAPFLRWMKGYPICLRQLASMMYTLYMESGDYLFKVGQENHHIYMITEGTLYLSLNQSIYHGHEEEPSTGGFRPFTKMEAPSGRTLGDLKIGGSRQDNNVTSLAKVVPDYVQTRLKVNMLDSRARNSAKKPNLQPGNFNIYHPPAFSVASSKLHAWDVRVNRTVLRLQRRWREKVTGRRADSASESFRGSRGGSQVRRQSLADAAKAATTEATDSVGTRRSLRPWSNMKSHVVHAPAYLGESCLWSSWGEWDEGDHRYAYNARCEVRAEVVCIPRAACKTILERFSPWLPERFEYFRNAVVSSLISYSEEDGTSLPTTPSNACHTTMADGGGTFVQ